MRRYTLGLYEKAMPSELTWKQKLEIAKKSGFDYVEISIDETEEKLGRLDMSKEERMMLINTCIVTGMPIRSMCLSGHRKYPLGSNDPIIAKRGMEIMEKAIDFADDLGIRIIQLAGYDVYYEEGDEKTKARFVKNLSEAVKLAASKAIVLGFETMETEFMNTVAKALEYVEMNGSPYLQIYPDIGNITNAACLYHSSVKQDMEMGKGHIVAIHLKETIPGKFREVPFGTGHVNFEEAIQTAWNLGVRKYVAEFWYTGNLTWEKDLCFANDMMREILDKQM